MNNLHTLLNLQSSDLIGYILDLNVDQRVILAIMAHQDLQLFFVKLFWFVSILLN